MKNISRGGKGFSFLRDSRYLELVCPDEFAAFRTKGLTNIAFATHEFWPGRQRLSRAGVLPFMFLQTHCSVLEHLDIVSMVEHVYLNYLAGDHALDSPETIQRAKERLYARHDEMGFLTKADFVRFGVPERFHVSAGGLRVVLKSLAERYAVELGYSPGLDAGWSASEFRRRFPERSFDTCDYCRLRPVDLHHLVPRATKASLAYASDNVVSLCVQVHGYITRRYWTPDEAARYQAAVKKSLLVASGSQPAVFREVMEILHESVYGRQK
jgi:hypothetical protein